MPPTQPIFRRSPHSPDPAPGLRCRATATWVHGAIGFADAPDPAQEAGWLRAMSVTFITEPDATPQIAAVAPAVLLADSYSRAVTMPSGAGGRAIFFSLDLRDVWPRLPPTAGWVHLSARELCAAPVRIVAPAERPALDPPCPLLGAYDAVQVGRWPVACDSFAAAFAREPRLRGDLDRPHLAEAARAAARAGDFSRASSWLEEHVSLCADQLADFERQLAADPPQARRELLSRRCEVLLAHMGLAAAEPRA